FVINIIAINGAGLTSEIVSTNGLQPSDPSPPSSPALYYGANSPEDMPFYISNLNEIIIGFEASGDEESGIAGYEYKIGTTQNGSEISDWSMDSIYTYYSSEDFNPENIPGRLFTFTFGSMDKPIGNYGIQGGDDPGDLNDPDDDEDSSGVNIAGMEPVGTGMIVGGVQILSPSSNRLKITDLQLESGHNYYLSVRAVNNAGLTSAAVCTKVIRPDNTPPNNFHVFPPYYAEVNNKIIVGVTYLTDVQSGIKLLRVDVDGGGENTVTSDYRIETWPGASPVYNNVFTYRFEGPFNSGSTYRVRVIVQNKAGLNSEVRTFMVDVP
ncbi:MAG: hypothetical protein KAR38_01425, partial [Calditrichia bacterium]|nr:hypothetical protein [Calditrichia bacterium]